MSTIAEALDHPVSPGIAAAVWQAHEEQVDRNKRETHGTLQVRGEVRWSVTAGFQFVPEEHQDGDRITDLLGGRDWHAGLKVTLTL
jgi:hypothetical protein